MKTQLTIQIATLAFALSANARDLPVPHGPDIDRIAAACPLGDGQGPLGQISKAGPYNPHCQSLTDAEVCLAMIKSTIRQNGEQKSNHYSMPERADFCLNEFQKNLLGAE